VVFLENLRESIIRLEEEASRSHASAVRLHPGKGEPRGHERGGSIQISDLVRITA